MAGVPGAYATPNHVGMVGLTYPIAPSSMSSTDSIQDIVNQVAAAEMVDTSPHLSYLLMAIDRQDSASIRQFHWLLAGSSVTIVQFTVLDGLIQRSDPTAIAQFAPLAATLAAVPGCLVLRDIGGFYRSTDATGLAALGSMAATASPVQGLQSFALMALAAIHTQATLPYLVEVMNGPATELHKEAVIGISWFANGVLMQTPQNEASQSFLSNAAPTALTNSDTKKYLGFDQSRAAEFISFWNGWWSTNRIALGF